MTPEERRMMGYPAGLDEVGLPCQRSDQCNRSAVPDRFVLQERIQDGRVVDEAGIPLTTPVGLVHLYVVDDDGRILVGLEHTRDRSAPGAVKHNSLLRGANVFAAGELRFKSGRVREWNIKSGTYKPPREVSGFVRALFATAGVSSERDSA